MIERDLSLAEYEGQPLHLMHLSARESVEALDRAQRHGLQATGEVTPHHLCLTDEAVRSLDANLKMNPPLRGTEDRAALVEGLRNGHDLLRGHRSRAARPAREGGALRGGAVRRHRARDRLRRALHLPRRARAAPARDAARADVRRAGARVRARAAADRGRCAGEPRAPRRERRAGRDRARLPLALGQLLAARQDAARAASRQTIADGRLLVDQA